MTGAQLRAWHKRTKLRINAAAVLFGVSEDTFSRWEAKREELPRYVAMTCAAISFGLPPAIG